MRAGRERGRRLRARPKARSRIAARAPCPARARARRRPARQRASPAQRLDRHRRRPPLRWRQWRRAPSFAAIAIATLGLGAGAATAIFSVVDAVLLNPLPYRQPRSSSRSGRATPRRRCRKNGSRRSTSWTTGHASRVRRRGRVVAAGGQPRRSRAREPVRVSTIETSANLFRAPRRVDRSSDRDSRRTVRSTPSDRIAVISDRLWRQRYNADPGIIGRTMHVNGGQYKIAGVMPPELQLSRRCGSSGCG